MSTGGHLFLVRGAPTPEELAAVIAVVTARSAAVPAAPPPRVRSRWATPTFGAPFTPAPGAWRASALPR